MRIRVATVPATVTGASHYFDGPDGVAEPLRRAIKKLAERGYVQFGIRLKPRNSDALEYLVTGMRPVWDGKWNGSAN